MTSAAQMNRRMDLHSAEVEAAQRLASATTILCRTAVVDDDYPRVKRQYDHAVDAFRQACVANGRNDLPRSSVVQDWLLGISRRQQGVVLLALRGPDGTRKESPAKAILRSLRACTMNSGRHGVPMERHEVFDGDSFMRMDLVCDDALWLAHTQAFYESIDEHNVHFLQHLLHAAAVLGFNHPMEDVAARWLAFYHAGVHKLHMLPETREQFTHRLRDGRRREEDE